MSLLRGRKGGGELVKIFPRFDDFKVWIEPLVEGFWSQYLKVPPIRLTVAFMEEVTNGSSREAFRAQMDAFFSHRNNKMASLQVYLGDSKESFSLTSDNWGKWLDNPAMMVESKADIGVSPIATLRKEARAAVAPERPVEPRAEADRIRKRKTASLTDILVEAKDELKRAQSSLPEKQAIPERVKEEEFSSVAEFNTYHWHDIKNASDLKQIPPIRLKTYFARELSLDPAAREFFAMQVEDLFGVHMKQRNQNLVIKLEVTPGKELAITHDNWRQCAEKIKSAEPLSATVKKLQAEGKSAATSPSPKEDGLSRRDFLDKPRASGSKLPALPPLHPRGNRKM